MSVTSAITSTYEEKPPLEAPKNKANPNPISNPQTDAPSAVTAAPQNTPETSGLTDQPRLKSLQNTQVRKKTKKNALPPVFPLTATR